MGDKESDLVYSLIVQFFDKGEYIHVRQTESTKDVWDALSQQYNKASLYQERVLRQKYDSVCYQLGKFKHINCMKTLHDQLNEMGDTITDKQLVCDLLASLPLEKYEPLITSLDVHSKDTLLLQTSDRKALKDSTRKDSKQNFQNHLWVATIIGFLEGE